MQGFKLRGRTIERHGDKFINKFIEYLPNNIEIATYYVFQERDHYAVDCEPDKPIKFLDSLGYFPFLEEARKAIGVEIKHPVKNTKPRDEYPKFTGTSRK